MAYQGCCRSVLQRLPCHRPLFIVKAESSHASLVDASQFSNGKRTQRTSSSEPAEHLQLCTDHHTTFACMHAGVLHSRRRAVPGPGPCSEAQSSQPPVARLAHRRLPVIPPGEHAHGVLLPTCSQHTYFVCQCPGSRF